MNLGTRSVPALSHVVQNTAGIDIMNFLCLIVSFYAVIKSNE